jgi:hypothetical protein
MSETGLIVAEVVFLVLLYAFVWTVVRSSARQLRIAQPPAAPAPQAPAPEPAAFSAPAPPEPYIPPAPPVVAAVPVPSRQETEEPLIPAGEDGRNFFEDRTEGAMGDENALDLSSNLDPRLIVDSSDTLQVGHTILLEGGITIGRSEAADLSIGDQFVSHMHARILRRGAYHFVEDLGSTNGTFLNDRRVESDAQLKVHDALRIGQTTLRYEE